ncbi:Glycosyltransferase involved in cell wall bisynthesis [Microbulbifer yueqingensis]|uniref:Glycosyltransferase involved in cell wall bisynthesis n=2 Tax=Microbulbifer yueqingensis TaxID=658219 RepID=A0A1G8ZM24_9GAMM|nr:Glycosyltransferase involved in cell wall bisynthesis [Microbulbifer yueqingensis]
MLTNTYLPHVGGVARSVAAFAEEYRARGHRVLIVAPEFSQYVKGEQDVVRIHAIQNFNGSDFSVALPFSPHLSERLDEFQPDIVHSHHPFLLGMTAVRIARSRELPLVFTHHTLYERYTHYVPADSQALKRFVIELATRYANLASLVFAPSESIADILRERGVTTPIEEMPTGLREEQYLPGDGAAMRAELGIPPDAHVLGHLGRLAPEKNLEFLAAAVADFMQEQREAHFLLVGSGPSGSAIEKLFEAQGLADRLHMPGTLQGSRQRNAYAAMDTFVFASTSETQGMVLTEAMAASVPVVALDANGCREVVRDRVNGCLVKREDRSEFVAAIDWLYRQPAPQRRALCDAALATARQFSMERCASHALELYRPLLKKRWQLDDSVYAQWMRLRNLIAAQWDIFEGVTSAAGAAFGQPPRR